MHSNYSAIVQGLVHDVQIQKTLRELMKEFLEYREIAQIRRACHALKRSEGRLEVVVEMITRHNAWRGGE